MELNEMEKKLLFQVEGDYQTKILNELYMTVRYSNNSEQREAAEGLMAKLRVLSNAECMDLVKDIQKNYRLPYPARTIGEKIAEARQQSGAEKLKGHDIMALERFDPEVKHMIVFDVLSYDSPVGDKGDKMRLFLTDAGYQNAGFTTGTPWIPLNPNYPQINAAKQVGDPDSVYSFYRRLLALRKSDKTFVYGHYALLLPDDEEIYAYTRTLNDEQILVVCNFTDHDVPCPLLNDWQNTELLISNYNTPGNPGSLRPFEAVVYRK